MQQAEIERVVEIDMSRPVWSNQFFIKLAVRRKELCRTEIPPKLCVELTAVDSWTETTTC